MKGLKIYTYATLLSLPAIGLLYYLLNPPQCPRQYTQEQVDAARCIVGANIGGIPLFVLGAIIIWFSTVWLVRKLINKKDPK